MSADDQQSSLLNLLSRRLESSEQCRNNLFAALQGKNAEIERLRALNETLQASERVLIEHGERLRKGVRDYLDGNYDHPRAHRHEPTKGCKHGRFYYEDCCECDADYFSALLGEEDRVNQQQAGDLNTPALPK